MTLVHAAAAIRQSRRPRNTPSRPGARHSRTIADDDIAISGVADRCLLSGGNTDIPLQGRQGHLTMSGDDPKRHFPTAD